MTSLLLRKRLLHAQMEIHYRSDYINVCARHGDRALCASSTLTCDGLIIPFGLNSNKQCNNTNTYINIYIYGRLKQPCVINHQAFLAYLLANKWISQIEEKEDKSEPTKEVTGQ